MERRRTINIIIDATPLDLYPFGKPGFAGGTELYIHQLAAGLSKTHLVHVVTADLEQEEQRGERLFYWPKHVHPTVADAVICVHNLENVAPYAADHLILASNGIGAYLGPDDEFATGLDAVACFSQCHVDLLTRRHPKVSEEKCHITGLGVELDDYDQLGFYGTLDPMKQGPRWNYEKVPGRMLYANDPQRGLWKTLDIFERVRKEVPDATLHIAYNWTKVFAMMQWSPSAMAEELWACRHKMATLDGVRDLGELSRDAIIQEQLACQVHTYPSDPPNVGSQIHGITQMECAAAGCALVLSDTEAFPEVFGEAATILPVPGAFLPEIGTRMDAQDWADVTVTLMQDAAKWQEASAKARQLAEQNTWDHVVARWNAMLSALQEGAGDARTTEPIAVQSV